MKKLLFLSAIIFIQSLASCDPVPGGDDDDPLTDTTMVDTSNINKDLIIGISRTELPWLSGGLTYQERLLDSLKAVDCKVVRFSISRSNLRDEVLEHILYANKLGLGVMVMIKTTGIAALYPEGTPLRDGEDRFWDVYCHSDLDTTNYAEWIGELLQYWKEYGCVIDYIEVGNEIAWADFNGDFPIYPRGTGFAYDESFTYSELPQKVKIGFEKIGVLFRQTREAVENTWTGEHKPELVLGGLNWFTDQSWLIGVGGTVMYPEYVLKILKGTVNGMENPHNYLQYVDGIGIHYYPNNTYSPNTTLMKTASENYISDFMGNLDQVTDLPIFITEMGYSININGAENDDRRAAMFDAFFEAMEENENYTWGPVYIYSWDQGVHALTVDGIPLYTAKHIFRD